MAEKYYIKQGDHYFAKTKLNNSFLTKNIADAWNVSDRNKAKQQLNALPKVIRGAGWKIENVDTSKTSGLSATEIFSEYTEIDLNGLLAQLDEITQKTQVFKNNKQWLVEKESVIDKKISDILHYLEFYPISASDGYMLSKQLQDLRRERRKIKNELHAISVISTGCAQIIDSSVQKSIRGMEDRKYTPRIKGNIFFEKQKQKMK